MNRTFNRPLQNKAKFGQDGTSGGRHTREGPIARNEPNFCHHADPEIGAPGRAKRAKRSQSAAEIPTIPLFYYSTMPTRG